MSMELIAKITLQSCSSFTKACKSVKSTVLNIVLAPQKVAWCGGKPFRRNTKIEYREGGTQEFAQRVCSDGQSGGTKKCERYVVPCAMSVKEYANFELAGFLMIFALLNLMSKINRLRRRRRSSNCKAERQIHGCFLGYRNPKGIWELAKARATTRIL